MYRRRYPAEFGETDQRASDDHPEGPQSYCIACRKGRPSKAEARLCSEFLPATSDYAESASGAGDDAFSSDGRLSRRRRHT